MKHLGDMLLSRQGFSEIVMGNTAIVRAMLEAQVRVVTSYPGSPTPEIAEVIKSIASSQRPFYFQFSVNEKVATEVAFGASVNGHFSTVFFKSVGLNVAADSFVQLGLFELIGGLVIVLGDDPGANSSQNEQDNRHYARLSYIPVFEPASPGEVYGMYLEAAALSKEKKMPVILRLTTHVCHAKEKVSFGPWEPVPPDHIPRFDRKNGPYIPITSAVFPLKRKALAKLGETACYSEKSLYHRLVDHGNGERGVITAGLPFLSLLDALEGAERKPDILKLGIVYPLARSLVADFLRSHREVKILEELDDLLEKDIKALAFEEGIAVKITGKTDPEDWVGEYTSGKVHEVLSKTWADLLPERKSGRGAGPPVPQRPAQMCPGCGHRSAFYAIKKALREGDITVADIGCHTLGFLEPYLIGEVLLCMGHSTGTGAGLSLFNKTRRVLAFLGDSTFFHAGIPGIVNALFNRHRLTLVIMENGTTAMTGHQDHPATGHNFNEAVDKIPVRKVLEGLGVKAIREVDTYDQKKLTEAVRESLDEEGFNVVIARHPCMLKFTRERRRKGAAHGFASVSGERCTKAHECTAVFCCPSFQVGEDGAVTVTRDLCIGDGSCLKACPSEAIELTTI
ncbi:MAG: indolepyruvate ferredoxin oxidoreductase subunit alpha [Candidatus Eremiobacteraeota bacterium]|nr:indolepyruvate ferredoxin oxidoreductase subunit alpha [Candidatus Eremiobacteraeota bacterium]